MSSWTALEGSIDTTLISLFGVAATLHPQNHNPDIAFLGVIYPPPIEEEFTPYGTTGVVNVRFFVRFSDISPSPRIGDTITLNSVLYNIFDIKADIYGGAMLILRKA